MPANLKKIIATYGLLIFLINKLVAGIGYPIITNYSSIDMNVTPQVWGIVQDNKGILYFATNVGVVKYNGVDWELYQTPSNSPVRSIAIDSDGNIFVGASREFGFLKPKENGKYIYVSLSDSLPEKNFKSVLKTFVLGNSVYFLANHQHIFKYSKGKVTEIDIGTIDYYRAFKVNADIYLLGDFGVAKLIDDKVVYKDTSVIPGNVYFFLPFGVHTLLAGTLKNGMHIYHRKENKWEKFTTEIDNEALAGDVYCGKLLRNGNYAIGTLKNGMFVLNGKGELLHTFNKESGILNNGIYCLFEDKYSDLWVGQEKGVSHIEFSTPFTKFGKESGLDGTLQKTLVHNNKLFCATSNGIYYLPLSKNGEWKHSTFKHLDVDYIYNLDYEKVIVPGNSEPQLITSCLRDILWVSDDMKIHELAKVYGCYAICASPEIPGRIYLGSPGGIEYLDLNFVNNKISVINHKKITNLNESIRDLIFSDDGNLWVRTGFNDVFKVDLNENKPVDSVTITNFPELDEKFMNLTISDMKYIDGIVYLATNYGLLSLATNEHLSKQQFNHNTSLGLNFSEDSLAVTSIGKDNMGNYWISLDKGILKYDHSNNELIETKYRRLSDNQIIYVDVLENFGTNILTEDELFFINGTTHLNLDFNFSTIFNKIEFGSKYKIVYDDQNFTNEVIINDEIPFNENSVTFEIGAPFYQKPEATMFSWYLDGFDKKWTVDSDLRRISYTNLPHGEYTFLVKSKNIYNNESEVISCRFIIETPWYFSLWAIFIFIILIIIVVYLIVLLYTYRLKQDRKRLQHIIRDAIRKEEEQKEEIEQQADKLLQANQELAKLSLVASKTDNAVIIMDAQGEIQWVNEGYEKMYGYTFDELISKGTKIIGHNANVSIDAMVSVWFGERKPIIYENQKESKKGQLIWVQTTLTPILDDTKKLVQLIAIDSDITKIKAAEAEIESQRDEIEAQRDMALQQRDEITVQKKEIIDSIKYANRIQRAILMKEKDLQLVFPNSFAYNKPRDIVSGDFYWAMNAGEVKVVACVDCTGHGVPGAFMSMIGVTYLNYIIKEKQILDPAEILDRLRYRVIKSLGQTGKDNEAKDGMDISICVINTKSRKLVFAGANNPAYIIKNGELHELEADKMPISIFHAAITNFRQFETTYNSDDMLYLFSDGYADQFGGEHEKKYKSRKFKDYLLKIHNLPMKEQKEKLHMEHVQWKNNLSQVDDILVLGVKLD